MSFVAPHSEEHGRLFTDADVGQMLSAILTPEQIAEVDLDKLLADGGGPGPKFPAGEPILPLRACDDAAVRTIGEYLVERERQGAGEDELERIRRHLVAVQGWRAANGRAA